MPVAAPNTGARKDDPWYGLDADLFEIEWQALARLELMEDEAGDLFALFQSRLVIWQNKRDVEGTEGKAWEKVLLSLKQLVDEGIVKDARGLV